MMQFGYFGKIPHRSDFVHFNLPQTFVNVWDDWLLDVLAIGQKQHGEAWRDTYLQSPVYRFGLSAGIAGESAWIGTMSPTADSTGQLFPFCIALALPSQINMIAHAQRLEPIYQALIELLRTIASADYNFDNLQEEMSEMLPALELDVTPHTLARFQVADPVEGLAIRSDTANLLTSTEHLPVLLEAVLQQTWAGYSTWQTIGESKQRETTVVASGLPTGSAALALFDCTWQTRDCGYIQLAHTSSAAQPNTRPTSNESTKDLNRTSPPAVTPPADSGVDHNLPFEFQPTERYSPEAKPWKSDT